MAGCDERGVGFGSDCSVEPGRVRCACVDRFDGKSRLTFRQTTFTFPNMASERAQRQSSSDIARRRAASGDLVPGLAVLIVSQASLTAASPDASASAWHLLWALSPLVGIGLLVWAQIRILRRSDERERAVELSAMAIGFGVVVTALAVVGVLQAAEIGGARQQLQVTTGLGIAAWVVALVALERRMS